MPFRQYFGGIQIELESPLAPTEVKKRINSEASLGLSPFYTGVVGRVWGQTLRLRYRSSPLEYNAKPLLIGPIEAVTGGCRLSLIYRGPRLMIPFFVFWLGFSLVGFVAAAIDLISSRDAEFALILFAMPIFALFPIGMHAWGTRRWDEDLGELVDFLQREAQASSNRTTRLARP